MTTSIAGAVLPVELSCCVELTAMPFLVRCNRSPLWPNPVRWIAIIGLLLAALALGGCSAVRLGYNNAQPLTYWWLDRYVDFDTPQAERVRADLKTLHDWHRAQALPRVADMLQTLRLGAPNNAAPEQLCSLYTEFRASAAATLDRMVPTLAAISPTLTDAQLDNMARMAEKRNQQWQEQWLEGSTAERSERRVKALVKRVQWFYGDLTPEQLALVQTHVNASDVDMQAIYNERLVRQKDALQTLRAVRDNPALTPAQREAELHAMLARAVTPPDPAVRASWQRWSAQTCAGVAALHNHTTEVQRARLADNLQTYEDDARALMAQR
jgi:hypothetical protein